MQVDKKKKKGLIIVNTGHGKGKSSAAFGVMFRAIGQNMKVAIVQYIKGKWRTGEGVHAKSIEGLTHHVMGLGFTWESKDINKDIEAAKSAWEKSKEYINDDKHDLVILDEFTYTLKYGWLDVSEVLEVLQNKPKMKHIIITGRDCHEKIIELADLVTEMKLIKHPSDQGIPAQRGIEF